jgi:hypothetical protein
MALTMFSFNLTFHAPTSNNAMPVTTSDIWMTVMVYLAVGNQKYEVACDGTFAKPNLMKIHQFVQMSLESANIRMCIDMIINPSLFFFNTATCKKRWHCHTCYLKDWIFSSTMCKTHLGEFIFANTGIATNLCPSAIK